MKIQEVRVQAHLPFTSSKVVIPQIIE